MERRSCNPLREVHERNHTMSRKYRFEIKVAFVEDDKIQVVILQGSGKGAPIAKGVIMRLPDASRSAFVEMMRQLDGGKITQVGQHDGQPLPDVR